MSLKIKIFIVVSIISFIFDSCWALPFTPFRTGFTEKGRMAIDLSVNYAVIAQLSNNQDLLTYDTGLKYGIKQNSEIFLNIEGYFLNRQSFLDNSLITTNEAEAEGIILGIRSLFKQEDLFPAVICFAETSIIEKVRVPSQDKSLVPFNRFLIGSTIYYTSDPLMPSLTAAYLYKPSINVKETLLDQADIFYIQPTINFMVNSEVTLFGGFTLNLWGPSYVNNQLQDIGKRELIINIGSNFILSKGRYLGIKMDLSPSYPTLAFQLINQL